MCLGKNDLKMLALSLAQRLFSTRVILKVSFIFMVLTFGPLSNR